MPIVIKSPTTVFDQDSFYEVDRLVTGSAFDVQNDFGRFLQERLYRVELARRLRLRGLILERELPMTLTLDSFVKTYYADFLVNAGVIVEAKAVEMLTPAHTAQVLNYLFLCGLHHATLLNFGSDRVQHQFVSTTLTPEDRRNVQWDTSHWEPLSHRCEIITATLERAILEWGAYLDPVLYRDAISHFLGGEFEVLWSEHIFSDDDVLGVQQVHHVTNAIAFCVTASIHGTHTVLQHQQRFLMHTNLQALHWINLNHARISLHTIKK